MTQWRTGDYMQPWGPIHDEFCRCPSCRLPYDRMAARRRLMIMLLSLVVIAIIAAFIR